MPGEYRAEPGGYRAEPGEYRAEPGEHRAVCRVSGFSGMVELWNGGIVEWWNGGMDFFPHPFFWVSGFSGMGIVEWWNNGMVEQWNGGMDFFFSSILFAWLSFQFTCFYFQAILLCMCVFVANFNNTTFKEQSNSKYSVMFYQVLLLCVGK